MKTLEYFAVTAQQVAKNPISLLKLEVTLNVSVTAGLFFQIHDAIATPADGSVPLRVWPAEDCGYKEFKYGELNLTLGCYVCLSSTTSTKTLAAGASDRCDILNLDLVSQENPTSASVTTIGDLVTKVSSLQVWNEGDGATARKTLQSLQVIGDTTVDLYLFIFPSDNPITDSLPMNGQIYLIPANKTKLFDFGSQGLAVFLNINGTNKKGCTVALSLGAPRFVALGFSSIYGAKILASYTNAA